MQYLLSHENIYEITCFEVDNLSPIISHQNEKSYDSRVIVHALFFHSVSMDKSLWSAPFRQWDKPSLQK